MDRAGCVEIYADRSRPNRAVDAVHRDTIENHFLEKQLARRIRDANAAGPKTLDHNVTKPHQIYAIKVQRAIGPPAVGVNRQLFKEVVVRLVRSVPKLEDRSR